MGYPEGPFGEEIYRTGQKPECPRSSDSAVRQDRKEQVYWEPLEHHTAALLRGGPPTTLTTGNRLVHEMTFHLNVGASDVPIGFALEGRATRTDSSASSSRSLWGS